MALLTGKTFGGDDWTPTFVMSIDSEKCIGCGRCFKSCARKVFMPEDFVDEETDSTRMIYDRCQPEQLHRLRRLRCCLPEEVLYFQNNGAVRL